MKKNSGPTLTTRSIAKLAASLAELDEAVALLRESAGSTIGDGSRDRQEAVSDAIEGRALVARSISILSAQTANSGRAQAKARRHRNLGVST